MRQLGRDKHSADRVARHFSPHRLALGRAPGPRSLPRTPKTGLRPSKKLAQDAIHQPRQEEGNDKVE